MIIMFTVNSKLGVLHCYRRHGWFGSQVVVHSGESVARCWDHGGLGSRMEFDELSCLVCTV
jgi:hypothetical protein